MPLPFHSPPQGGEDPRRLTQLFPHACPNIAVASGRSMHASHNAAPVHRVNEVIGVRDTIRGGMGCLPLTQSRILPRVIEFKTGDIIRVSGSRMPYVSELNEDGPQSRQTICKSPAVTEGRSHNCEGDPPSRLCILNKIRGTKLQDGNTYRLQSFHQARDPSLVNKAAILSLPFEQSISSERDCQSTKADFPSREAHDLIRGIFYLLANDMK